MKAPWHESKGLVPWMILLTILLIGGVAVKEGWLSFMDFAARKDEIDGITKILGIIILLTGGIFSYLRFFKGRTFQQKLNISPTIGVIPLENQNLHWIDVQLENRGSVPIWNHETTIYATLHTSEPYCERLTEFMPTVNEGNIQEHLIDVGESLHEHAFIKMPKHINAITYQIVVRDDKGTIWDRCITGANSEPADMTKNEKTA